MDQRNQIFLEHHYFLVKILEDLKLFLWIFFVAVAGIVAGAGLLASALGEGAFQLRKIATKPIQDAKKAFDNEKNPLMKMGRGAFLGGMNALLGPLSALGVLLDVVGAPFRYAIELLRFPFLSEEDKQKQSHNLAKMDARIREDFRKALNMVTLGFAFKEKGSFGNIYGNKGAQKEMMSKMAGGGSPISANLSKFFARPSPPIVLIKLRVPSIAL